MSTEQKYTEQQLFDQLISSLVHSAWVFLGKIKNPVNDELERDLDQASIQIDMLDMLFKRMKGNLSDNEDQYLDHLVRELKMNFVEEKNKPEDSPSTNGEAKDEANEAAEEESNEEEPTEKTDANESEENEDEK